MPGLPRAANRSILNGVSSRSAFGSEHASNVGSLLGFYNEISGHLSQLPIEAVWLFGKSSRRWRVGKRKEEFAPKA